MVMLTRLTVLPVQFYRMGSPFVDTRPHRLTSEGTQMADRARAGVMARTRAMTALLEVEEGAGSQAAIRRALDQEPALQGADRGLATALVYSALRHQRPVDRWLDQACSRGLAGVGSAALIALRLGVVQLAFLTRIPTFAAVDTTIQAAKGWLSKGQIGFVHGVLRRLARETPWQDAQSGADLPPWIAERLAALANRLDVEPAELINAFEAEAPLHVHLLASDRQAIAASLAKDGVECKPVGGVPGACHVIAGEPFASAAFGRRQLIAQDGGSAAIVEWLGDSASLKVLDLAAGRGGKSLFLSAAGAEVSAVDVDAEKLAAAAQLAQQAGHTLHETIAVDGRAESLPAEAWDAVLLDAPCTGLGTLRRRPEIRHRRRAADVLRLASLQAELIRAAARCVRPGGLLLYATCSPLPEEGVQVVEALLAERPEFVREPGDAPWVADLLDQAGDLWTHPMRHGMDAFYAARLRRQSGR